MRYKIEIWYAGKWRNDGSFGEIYFAVMYQQNVEYKTNLPCRIVTVF